MDAKRLFGENLKKLRKSAELSQEQLAEKVGVSTKHIGALETGVSFVSSDLLEKFAELFNTSISTFFMEKTETPPTNYSPILEEIDKIVSKKMSIAMTTIINETKRYFFASQNRADK